MSQGTQDPECTSSICSPHRCSVLRELVPAQLTSHPADVGSLIQDAIRAELTMQEHRLPSHPPDTPQRPASTLQEVAMPYSSRPSACP